MEIKILKTAWFTRRTLLVSLCLGLMFCIFAGKVKAQECFPTSNAIWNYKVSAENWLTGQSGERTIYYTIYGDTIVNDYNYTKLYETFDTVMSDNNLGDFLGGFRQEGQKVYFIPYNKAYYPYSAYFGQEFLLYDFGVSIDDTVHIEYKCRYYLFTWQYQNKKGFYFDFSMNKALIVRNIEIRDGIKRISLENEYNGYDIWYEGIGSPIGFFNAGTIRDVLDGYSFDFSLNCFKHNDTVKYLNNPKCNKCFCEGYIGIKNYDTENNSYLCQNQPNPFSKSTEIRYFIAENVNQASLLIFDLQGILIKQIPVYDKGESKTIINKNELQVGVYIYQLVVDGKEIDSKKMIITK